jgi:hypothetical protein
MSTFGPNNFEITSNANKPKIGQLSLTYTLNNDSTITNASVTYTPPAGNGNSETFNVTFTGTQAPYSGVPSTQPIPNNWNVPGEGAYKYATFSFTPPANGAAGTFTGQASKSEITEDDTIAWEADSSTQLPAGSKAATQGKH